MPEAAGRWTGKNAVIRIGGWTPQVLKVTVAGWPLEGRPFKIHWNNRLVFNSADSEKRRNITFDLAPEDVRELNELRITCPLATSPSQPRNSTDSRILGMFIDEVDFLTQPD
jgi:hypothetical protein